MEIKVIVPPVLVPFYPQYFAICDESRTIAAEYKDGLKSYPDIFQAPTVTTSSSKATSLGTFTTVNGITLTNTVADGGNHPSNNIHTSFNYIQKLPISNRYVVSMKIVGYFYFLIYDLN